MPTGHDSEISPLLQRRGFLHQTAGQLAGAAVACSAERLRGSDRAARKPRVAVLFTAFHYYSHAHVFLENFLAPYVFNGQTTDPGVEVVSLYADQFPKGDMARDVARDFKIPLYPTVAAALCRGGEKLAVDAVLSIGEHGDYPVNAQGQRLYPRKRFFDEAAAVFERSGRAVPLFNDKHLSYRWDWAKEMYDTATRLRAPLMAGSSVPLAQRRPPLELPTAAKVVEAVAIHGGGFESYDFHGLEILQSVVEARAGGETGVDRVQMLEGKSLWEAAEAGHWSPTLADAALAAESGPGKPPLRRLVETEPRRGLAPSGILVTYRDGLRGLVLAVGDKSARWNFACRLAGEGQPRATAFYPGPWGNRTLFKALSHAVQAFFREGRAPYPVERTLLTTGLLTAAVDSRHGGGKVIATPHLQIAYEPRDFRAFRETGASWRILTDGTPEPKRLTPTGTGR